MTMASQETQTAVIGPLPEDSPDGWIRVPSDAFARNRMQDLMWTYAQDVPADIIEKQLDRFLTSEVHHVEDHTLPEPLDVEETDVQRFMRLIPTIMDEAAWAEFRRLIVRTGELERTVKAQRELVETLAPELVGAMRRLDVKALPANPSETTHEPAPIRSAGLERFRQVAKTALHRTGELFSISLPKAS
jgi:hypothetical protein